MDDRVRHILEYDKIAKQIAGHAESVLGASLCVALTPGREADYVRESLSLTEEADQAWTRIGGNPMQTFSDCRELSRRCATGSIPAPAELLEAAKTLRAIRLVKEKLGQCENIQRMRPYLSMLIPQLVAEREIFRCVVGDDEIADDASADLRNIRRRLRQAAEQVRQKLNDTISSSSMRTMLQDNIVTMRNGRYVVPVKAEYASAFGGLVHDRSGSGATVYIEPLSVLQANNEMRELEAAERNEIQRILQTLGELIGNGCEAIEQSIQAMGELDVLFAKVGWGREHKASCPNIQDGGFCIIGARHPLIAGEKTVPINIVFNEDTKALIITGPNTGGKTVTLKTIGLFILLAQSGVFLPCAKADLPCYEEVFADVGDEQSIEQSLSTFSSHIVNIVDILNRAKDKTMVLIDELGVGTDPVEGAALAIAILQALTDKGACVIATTHYSELKSFAMSEPGYINAGMEFDVATLQPTYKLLIGFAGSSNAFEIGRRLGLPDDLIENAKLQVSQEAMRLESAIAAAEALRLSAKLQLENAERQAKEERSALQMELETLRQKAQREEQKAKEALEKARKTLESARQSAGDAVEQARLAASAENRMERERRLQSARTAQRAIAELQSGLENELSEEEERQSPKNIEIGDRVYVQSLRTTATVLAKPDSKGDVMVQAGIVKLSVPRDQIRLADVPQQKEKESARIQRGDKSVPMEIDVRGMTVDEAVAVVDLHLDAASMAGMHQTSIIHGKGTGALRAGIRSYLKRHPHVKSMRSGTYGEGEDGVTIVEIK